MSIITREIMMMQALDMLKKTGFFVTDKELEKASVTDFGLDNLDEEGFVLIDLLRTDFVRTNLMILMPNQTLPQHMHPAYGGTKGKEETVRVLYGQTKIYIEGEQNNLDVLIPKGKVNYYTALKEIKLEVGEQFSVPPNVKHWFQAGPDGSVNIAFQNRVNEDNNIFYDPESAGCKISNEELK